MAPIVARGPYLAFASRTQVLLIHTETGTWKTFSFPSPASASKSQVNGEANGDQNLTQNTAISSVATDSSHVSQGTCLAFTRCGSFLAACNELKQLFVLQVPDLAVVHSWEVPRKISTLTFTKDASKIIIADKAGDAYSYEVSKPTSPTLLLGHLSMVLDMVLSHDEKYIITADRDEKIRVSMFPNAYNINNFCLGHTEFVSTISLLPSHPEILLSGSGDGMLKLWDYHSGKCLHTKMLKSDDAAEKQAIRKIATSPTPVADGILAAVILNKIHSVEICHIQLAGGYSTSISQTLDLKSLPLDIAFGENGTLYVLEDDEGSPIKTFTFSPESNSFVQTESVFLSSTNLSEVWLILADVPKSFTKDISPFYKRWFDNMQVYQERKNERINSSKKSSNSERSSKRVKIDSEEKME